jgi:hypothetical protein
LFFSTVFYAGRALLKGGEVEDEYDEYDMPISNPVPPPPNKQRNEKCGRRSGTSEFICPLLHFWKDGNGYSSPSVGRSKTESGIYYLS